MTQNAPHRAIASEMGKYHIIAELARGGMGNVYLAALSGPAGFSKLLVVKELKPELCAEDAYVTMFLEEARLAARLIHPNIVQLNEVHTDGGRYFMAMEYLDGRSLSRVVRRWAREGGFPVGAHLRVIGDCLLGLHYAHELRGFDGEPLGIVHRDVSPLNVMVTFDGQAKLLDFGIAKAVDSPLETKAGVLKGRIAYMAPEQACGARVDRRADVYSVGVMLWEAAAGRRMWPGMSEVEILKRVLRDGPPTLRSVVPGVPADLDSICARATARECENRYATAAELAHDLDRHIARRDDTMTVRQIGETIGVLFTEERHKMTQVIEERLANTGSGPRSGVIATSQGAAWAERSSHSRPAPSSGPEYAAAIWDDAPSLSAVRGAPIRVETRDPAVVARQPTRRGVSVLAAVLAAMSLGLLAAAGVQRFGAKTPAAVSANGPPQAPRAAITAVPTIGAPPASASLSVFAPAVSAPPPATVAPRIDSHDVSKTAAPPPRARAATKALPEASATASATDNRRPPAVNCDPPYTVDSNGIEHFKTNCL